MELEAVAKRIEALAKEKYGSTNKMVEASDGELHSSILYNMKREKASIPNIVVFQKIADLLETTTDYLMTGEIGGAIMYPRYSESELKKMAAEGVSSLLPFISEHNISDFGTSPIGVSVSEETFNRFASGELIPTILELDLINAVMVRHGVDEEKQPAAFAKLFLTIFDKNLFESGRLSTDELRKTKHAAIVYGTNDNPKVLPVSLRIPNDTSSEQKPLSNMRAADVLERPLIELGLANQDGTLSEKGSRVLLDFIYGNANMLKQVINED